MQNNDTSLQLVLPAEQTTHHEARRASGGLAVRSGVRAGSRVKTSDKQQEAMLAFVKG